MIDIYLDDVRPTPPGFVRCYWPADVIVLLEREAVGVLSLDHDLGDADAACAEGRREITGNDVIEWIEERVVLDGFEPPRDIRVHSDNAAAVAKMKAGIASIYRRAGR